MRSPLRRLLSTLAIATLVVMFSGSPATAEVTGPELVSISVPAGPYRPGSTVKFTIELTHADQLTTVGALFQEKSTGHSHWIAPQWEVIPAAGPVTYTYVIPSSGGENPFNNVEYSLVQAGIGTADNQSTLYMADGSMRSDWLNSGTHDVALDSTLRFTGSDRDDAPPVLTSLSISQTELIANGRLRVYYDVAGGDLHSIVVWGIANDGSVSQLGANYGAPLAGRGSTSQTIDDVGRWDVYRVDLTDTHGNHARYFPDGRLTTGTEVNYEVFSGRHSAHIESSPIVARPGPVETLVASPRSGAVDLSWWQERLAGHSVLVSPGGRVITSPPTSAYGHSERITGLTNGTTYTFTVTATSAYGDGQSTTAQAVPRMGAMRVFGTGDRSKDGKADLWAAPSIPAGQTSTSTWRIYQGTGTGSFGRSLTTTIPATKAPIPGSATGKGPGASMGALYLNGGDLVEPTAAGTKVIGRGFNIFRTIDASSDLTGDGVADLIGITPAGEFYVYASSSTGALGKGVRLGTGWGAFQSVFSPGDFNGDTRADLVAIDGVGKLWLYPGNGVGSFRPRVQIGSGWASFGSVLPLRDFNGDGKTDVGAITTDGRLLMYPGNGRGGFLTKSQIGTGWSAFL